MKYFCRMPNVLVTTLWPMHSLFEYEKPVLGQITCLNIFCKKSVCLLIKFIWCRAFAVFDGTYFVIWWLVINSYVRQNLEKFHLYELGSLVMCLFVHHTKGFINVVIWLLSNDMRKNFSPVNDGGEFIGWRKKGWCHRSCKTLMNFPTCEMRLSLWASDFCINFISQPPLQQRGKHAGTERNLGLHTF